MNNAGGNLALFVVFDVLKLCTRLSKPRPDATLQQLVGNVFDPLSFRLSFERFFLCTCLVR